MPEAPEEPVIQIAGLCGSLRAGSYTRMALELALEGAREEGAATHLLDLREYDLPHVTGKGGLEQTAPNVLRLRANVKSAHGIILATPEYHGSFSGVIKNALDLLGFDEFEGKMIGLVGVSGGRMGAFDALNSLRNIGRALHAWVIPQQASVPEAWKVFDDSGRPKNQDVARRLHEVGVQVARFARLHRCAAAHDFLVAWQKAPQNPGG